MLTNRKMQNANCKLQNDNRQWPVASGQCSVTRGEGRGERGESKGGGRLISSFLLHPSSFLLHPSSFVLSPSFFLLSSFLVLALAAPAVASKAPNRSIEDIRSMRLGPTHPATEADRDRKAALALLMTGAAHQRHDRPADALRCFERAWRLDPQSSTILHGILPLAIRLDRGTEAARWAIKVSDPSGADPKTLHFLGLQLAARGDWTNALKLYRWSLAADADGRKSASGALRQMEMGRICFMAGKPKDAAKCFAEVVRALDKPKEYGIEKSFIKKHLFADKPGPTYQFIGDCFLAADRPDDAKAAYEKAEPDKALRHYNQARLLAKTGQTAEALAALESALAERLDGQGLTPYELLEKWLDVLDKKSELIGRLEKLHTAEPDNVALSYFLADQYCGADQPDKAESLYRGLLKKRPSAAGYRGLMDLYRQGKRYDALLEVLGDAVEKIGILQTLQTESQTVSDDAAATAALARIARERLKKRSSRDRPRPSRGRGLDGPGGETIRHGRRVVQRRVGSFTEDRDAWRAKGSRRGGRLAAASRLAVQGEYAESGR